MDMYLDEEEATPLWVIELQEKHHKYMENYQTEINKIETELKEIDVRIKTADEAVRSSNAVIASCNAVIASSVAKIESLTLKNKLALEEVNEIQEKIDKTKAYRAEREKYWEDLISKEIQKRCKCCADQRRKASSRKSSTKRLNNNSGDYKHAQTKTKKEKLH